MITYELEQTGEGDPQEQAEDLAAAWLPETPGNLHRTFAEGDLEWATSSADDWQKRSPHQFTRLVKVTREVVLVRAAKFEPEDDGRDPETIGLPDHSRDNISFIIHD